MRPTLAMLSESERAYVERCQAFAREVIEPNFRAADDENRFPEEIHRAAHAAGLLNVGLPVELGGQGLSHRALALGGLAMARVCAPAAFTLGFNHGSMRPFVRFGSELQRDRFVRQLLLQRGYASWCMTEPERSGSSLLSMDSRAERTRGGWLLRGEKCMIGMGTVASVFAVLAMASNGEQQLGPTIFAVPRGDGVEVSANTDKLGFRCLPTPTVRFHDVFVPDEHVVGPPGAAVPVLLDSLDYMRLGGGIVSLGLVDGALSELLPWLESRHVYGEERLVDTSHVQITLGRLVARRHALDSLLFTVADALERDSPCAEDSASLKLLASELAVDATAQAMQLWGWRGIDARFASEKRFRDARQTTIYEGTSEIQAMNLFRGFVRDERLLP